MDPDGGPVEPVEADDEVRGGPRGSLPVPGGQSAAQVLVESHVGGEERAEQADVGEGQVEGVDLGEAALVREGGDAGAQQREGLVHRQQAVAWACHSFKVKKFCNFDN